MSATDVSSEVTTPIHGCGIAEMELESAVVPVPDADRARVAR
jgi:hypothetical protein